MMPVDGWMEDAAQVGLALDEKAVTCQRIRRSCYVNAPNPLTFIGSYLWRTLRADSWRTPFLGTGHFGGQHCPTMENSIIVQVTTRVARAADAD